MTLMKWDPFREFFDPRARGFIASDDAFGAWAPPVDIFEKGDDLVIRAEVPGVDREEIDVRVEDNVLVLKGERKRASELNEENAHRVERSYGAFVRSFRLPATVDASRIAATYRDGVLEIKLPKAEEAKPKRIEIKAA